MIVDIEKIVYGGKGLGRINGRVVFVPFSIDGERVEVEIKREKKGIIEAQIKEVLEKSPFRREPLCKYFRVCGGCDFQHIDYKHQIEIKREILRESLERIGKLKRIPEIQTLPSRREFFYRNRTQLKIYGSNVGFYMKESHNVVDIDTCPLLIEPISKLPSKIKLILSLFVTQPFEVQTFGDGNSFLLKFLFTKKPKMFPVSLKQLRKVLGINIEGAGIYYKKGETVVLDKVFGKKFINYKVGDYTFKVSIDSFFQINVYQIENLINTVLKHVKNSKFLADMYCGVGTFSIPSALYVNRVFGFEINKFAVKDAKENAVINKVKNVKFYPFETKRAVDFILENDLNIDTVIFDPPRTGLNEYIISRISKIKTLEKVIYVSCNPSTLARDLKSFGEKGFFLKEIYMIDMFPQTYHIESIAILERKS